MKKTINIKIGNCYRVTADSMPDYWLVVKVLSYSRINSAGQLYSCSVIESHWSGHKLGDVRDISGGHLWDEVDMSDMYVELFKVLGVS